LRAIKSVLVVAGKFKRSEPDVSEAAILMRALGDFNLPKIPE
jgi:dynein heavy chain